MRVETYKSDIEEKSTLKPCEVLFKKKIVKSINQRTVEQLSHINRNIT